MASSRRTPILKAIQVWLLAIAMAGWVAPAGASELDLTTAIGVPEVACPYSAVTVTVGYANLGPEPAFTPYVNVTIPSGVPAPIDELTPQQFNELQASAEGTDTLGNSPVLFLDGYGCEHLLFQLQGPVPPGPIQGLLPLVAGSFSFDLDVPPNPEVGHLAITAPDSIAGEFLPALTRHQRLFDDGPSRRYGRGLNCNSRYGGCSEIGDCFGARLSLVPEFAAEMELVNGAGGGGDGTLACGSLNGFSPGRIAVIRRGYCSFFVKAYYAVAAGASAVIVVNDGQCETGDVSADCVVDMNGGILAGEIDIPVVMLSAADGGPIIEKLQHGESVQATLGASPLAGLELATDGFLVDPNEIDPDPSNNAAVGRLVFGMFADGFECGGTSGWSRVVP